MKRSVVTNLVIALAVVLTLGGTALAGPVTVSLNSSAVILEMADATGSAYVDLKYGVVKVKVKNLPRDPVTHAVVPVHLTDDTTVPPTVKEAKSYQVYLFRVELVNGGGYVITGGLNLGVLKVSNDRSGALDYRNGGNMDYQHYNVVAVTAEEDPGAYGWEVPLTTGEASTWAGQSGVIVMWGDF